MASNLTISSYNCTGFGPGKPEYVSELIKAHDFVLLQEHWLMESQFHRIKNIPCDNNVSILSHDVSGIDNTMFLNGRGYGGCSILWKNSLNCIVSPVIMNSNRICAVNITRQSMSLLLFNVYMPCDTRCNDDLYCNILTEIMSTCNIMNCSNFIIGGDMNTSFNRVSSNFTKHLNYICERETIKPCIDFEGHNVCYTFTSPVDNGTHVIDHFLLNNGLFDHMLEYYTMHDGANLSFHSPLVLTLSLDVNYCSPSSRRYISRPKWQEASDCNLSQYSKVLERMIDEISIPWHSLECRDKHCPSRLTHCHDIQIFHDSIMDCCIRACQNSIPHTSKEGNSKVIAGWNEHVKPYREASLFWHNLWKDCGSPRNAVIADVMRRSRSQYHRAVRFVKRNQNNVKKESMATALLGNKSRDFWKEVGKVTKNNNMLPNMVDEVTGDENISKHFATKYEDLYNSVAYNDADMTSLLQNIHSKVDAHCNEGENTITVHDVLNGINHVKINKCDGYGVIYTDHFIHAPTKLHVFLSLLFTAMVYHGYTPDGFNISTIQPLVKNKRKSANNSDNYRAIALSSPLSKIFDWVIMIKSSDALKTSDLQFGFKPQSSTAKCTFALMETVNYFQQNKSDVYVLLLDATKAFDKVNYVKLFNLLMDRGMNPLLIRCLLYMYTNQHLNVSWNNSMSLHFSTANGVKQGGVLSPILFSIYIDEMLTRLCMSGFGCMIGHKYYGAVGYADDISLVAPSIYALNKMCDICLKFAYEYDLQFNPAKCQLIKYGSGTDCPFYFDGLKVKHSKKGLHLGHVIGPDAHQAMVKDMCHDFIWRVNALSANFGFCNINIKRQLYMSYCTSFYGVCLWNLQNKHLDMFYTTWRKGIRKLFNLPVCTHCNMVPLLADCLPIQIQIMNRMVRFMQSCLKCSNSSLKMLSHLAFQGSGSYMSKSFNYIMSKFKLDAMTFFRMKSNQFYGMIQDHYQEGLDDELVCRVSFAKDVLHNINNVGSSSFLAIDELRSLLTVLCTQ